VENIKKFLHISPRKKKGDAAKIEEVNRDKNRDNRDRGDRGVLEERQVTTRIEISNPVIPPQEEIEDPDYQGDRCESCRRAVKFEICLENGRTWHYKCFRCYNCGSDVSQQKYAYERECLMCEPCLASKVRTTCSKCRNVIDLEDTKLIIDGRELHKKCFVCAKCFVQLDKGVFGKKDGRYYCEPCYIELEGKHCTTCNKVIIGEGLRFGEEMFHKECFSCSKCQGPLDQGSVHAIKGKPVCGSCNELQFQETCTVCKTLVSEGLMFREKRFHAACFKCQGCAADLSNRKGEFILTEEGLQCNTCVRNRIQIEAELAGMGKEGGGVMDSCSGCKLPIHVKNLVFDGEKNWHQRCFICSQCNMSLVNEKYYDKGSDGLFCANCFLARHLPTCYACKIEIRGTDGVKMESDGGQLLTWHQSCLTCSVCCQAVGLDNVVFKNSLFCKSCYITSTLDKCDACKKLITGVGFGFRGQFWHDTCFGCDGCHKIFTDGKFHALRAQKLCQECVKNVTHPQ